MSDGDGDSLLAIFVLTIIVFVVLSGTIFYEEPSCTTANINPYGFLLPLFISGVVAITIVLIGTNLWKTIKEKRK